MGKVDFCFVALPRNLEDNVGALPLRLVLSEVEVVIENVPDNFLIGHHLRHFHRAAMHVFVTIRPLIAEVCSAAFDVFRPPTPRVVDRVKDFLGRSCL
jgi:hypothetical protein